MKRVCVFCGSSDGARLTYAQVTRDLGREMVQRGIGLVYGGGNIGLMHILAEEVLSLGGEVIGVIPKFMVDKELARSDLSTLHVVGSMHERKSLMAELSEAFIALPGGYGTLEEFCEMVTWKQLDLLRKPCGLLNVDGFFDLLLAFFDHQMGEGFVSSTNRALVMEAKNPATLLDLLRQG